MLNKTETRTHVAYPIPKTLWFDPKFFNQQLTQTQINIIDTPIVTLLEDSNRIKFDDNDLVTLACAMLGNEKATAEQLFQFAKKLDVYPFYLFLLGCTFGHMPLLKRVLQECHEPNTTHFMSYGNYLAYRQAAFNGHLPVLFYLEAYSPKLTAHMISFTITQPQFFQPCILNECLHVLQHFKEKEPGLIKPLFFQAHQLASVQNNLSFLGKVEQIAPEWIDEFNAHNNTRALNDRLARASL